METDPNEAFLNASQSLPSEQQQILTDALNKVGNLNVLPDENISLILEAVQDEESWIENMPQICEGTKKVMENLIASKETGDNINMMANISVLAASNCAMTGLTLHGIQHLGDISDPSNVRLDHPVIKGLDRLQHIQSAVVHMIQSDFSLDFADLLKKLPKTPFSANLGKRNTQEDDTLPPPPGSLPGPDRLGPIL